MDIRKTMQQIGEQARAASRVMAKADTAAKKPRTRADRYCHSS